MYFFVFHTKTYLKFGYQCHFIQVLSIGVKTELMYVCKRVCVCVCVRACVRVCCVCLYVRFHLSFSPSVCVSVFCKYNIINPVVFTLSMFSGYLAKI